MPTRAEIRNFIGDDRLTNKISKTLGYYGWAAKLNLKVQENDTRKGKMGEEFAAALLEARGYSVLQMPQNYPYDLLVNDFVKIDVKFSNLYHGIAGNFYSFALRKKYPTCDIYLLIANGDEQQKSIYILPSKNAIQTQISIGERTSIYDKYCNRYETIDQFLKIQEAIF